MSLPAIALNAWLRYDLVQRMIRDLDIRSVLEIGAGQGAVGARLALRYDYTAVEPDPISFAKAKERLARTGRGTIHCGGISALPPGATFDLVCAFEVLEHIEDDVGALREWGERVRPGGWLLVSVPARPHRFGAADRKGGHYRRYDAEQIAKVVRAAGFDEPQAALYGVPFGYALETARNVLARMSKPEGSLAERTGASGRWMQPPDSLAWLTQAVSVPFRVLQRPFARSRWGTGLVVLARAGAQPEETRKRT